MTEELRNRLRQRREAGSEHAREKAVQRRHERGARTARENLAALIDPGSLVEYGELAVAAQRQRRESADLIAKTSGDGVITGLATINSEQFGAADAKVAVVINDQTVLAATQGFYHHKKVDRLLEIAAREQLPVVMYTEGGGGRPGDTDVTTQVTGLDVPTFARWAKLAGKVPRITVNHGYCFAGNGLLFGCGDLRIATRESWIGMAGPAMIEAGGLGSFAPTDIGPAPMHALQGTVDLVVEDEAAATDLAQRILGMTQGDISGASGAQDQAPLRDALPDDRRFTYKLRPILNRLFDSQTFIEIGAAFGAAVVTGFARLDGKAVAVIANDNQVLAGAIDADAAAKCARFIRLADAWGLPVVSLVDTPGFMVGPDSEAQAAVQHMSELFIAAASLTVPLVAIFLRKAYGLGAMAMAAGGFDEPRYCAAWPSGEFGAMGLEGAVRLGFRNELEQAPEGPERDALFEQLVDKMYEQGSAIEVASMLEIDQVIDPMETRETLLRALA